MLENGVYKFIALRPIRGNRELPATGGQFGHRIVGRLAAFSSKGCVKVDFDKSWKD